MEVLSLNNKGIIELDSLEEIEDIKLTLKAFDLSYNFIKQISTIGKFLNIESLNLSNN
jgi:Leucine-rich repeat (LRR) protein